MLSADCNGQAIGSKVQYLGDGGLDTAKCSLGSEDDDTSAQCSERGVTAPGPAEGDACREKAIAYSIEVGRSNLNVRERRSGAGV